MSLKDFSVLDVLKNGNKTERSRYAIQFSIAEAQYDYLGAGEFREIVERYLRNLAGDIAVDIGTQPHQIEYELLVRPSLDGYREIRSYLLRANITKVQKVDYKAYVISAEDVWGGMGIVKDANRACMYCGSTVYPDGKSDDPFHPGTCGNCGGPHNGVPDRTY